MNEASAWRFALGRRIGGSYAADPKARVVLVSGSTGRGTADRYSDLEIDVYWSEPPSDEERRAAAEGAGGVLLDLAPYEEDEWAETISVGGFHISTSTFLVETMERYLKEVMDEYSTAPLPQIRLYALLHARALKGEDLARRWRARAAAYPGELVRATLVENLDFGRLGAAEMLAARDDLVALYSLLSGSTRKLMGSLLGLNRLYLPTPAFKGMGELIAEMRHTPPDLASRLSAVFRLPPTEGVDELYHLWEETLDLIDAHVEGFDTTEHREALRYRRDVWDGPPK